MTSQQTAFTTHRIQTPSGRISYVEAGSGPVALFVHGVLLNKHLWRHQLSGLSDIRRCIAVDLLAHGDTEIEPNQDVSVTANANMLREALDALRIDQVELVGNDSGGGIAQIFAALNPNRVRSLTLTDCDTHDNWPPEAFKPFVEMVAAGGLSKMLNAMLADKSIYRSLGALGPGYERPETATDEDIEIYLRPASPQRAAYARPGTFRWRVRSQAHSGDRTSIAPIEGSDTDRLGYGRCLLSGQMGALARRSDPRSEAPGRTAWGANILPRGASRGVQSVAARALGRVTPDAGDPTPHKSKIPPARHCICCWKIESRNSFQY